MLKKLATKEYVDNEVSKVITINITSEATLNKAVSENQGRMLFLILQNSITINGITIREWSQIFIPNATVGDMVAICIYPNNTFVAFLGHTTSDGWFIKKI